MGHMKDLEMLLAMGLVFAFVAFLFPTMLTAVNSSNSSLAEQPLLLAMPIILILVVVFGFIYITIEGRA